MKKQRKILKRWKTNIFGFPVIVDSIDAFKFEGEWVADVDYEALGEQLIELLLDSHRPLTGAQMRFVRKQLDLSQTELGLLIGKKQPHIARAESRDSEAAFESFADQFALIVQLKAKWLRHQNKSLIPKRDDIFSAEEFENDVEPKVELKRA